MKEAKSSGGSIVETYQVSNTPVGDLFTAYAFERLGAITVNHSAVGAGGTDTITYGLKLDSTGALRQADNVTGATDGLAIKLDSTGALRQNGGTGTTDGLSIKLDTTGGALVQTSGSANENGLALKLDETNVLTQTPASGLTVNLSSGLTVTSNKIAPVLGNGLALLDTAGTTGATTHINVKLSEINNNALTIESDGVYARGMFKRLLKLVRFKFAIYILNFN
ncbi:MAG: hypothetical protein EZS28_008767 [Streblomastix strix]|uniref:Uncharacterized protein n=1 Tax=Streblomastix strix TaxID=222440 RepID=A0A5J4WND9_9EUKA|nr:MAG: hypothetical protein EZS28_008767 [Streblomastix strix]